MNKMLWIATIIVLISLVGCRTDQKVKVVTDINQKGEVVWHTEYNVEW